MSSIPSSVIPHARAAIRIGETPRQQHGRLVQALRIAAAPAVVALGLSAMALSWLRRPDAAAKPEPETVDPVVYNTTY